MGIRIGMLVLWLCSCAAVSSDPPRDDGGTGDNGNGNGSGGVDIGINRSGTRIKMKVLNTPDGAKVFQGSYDTLRNEECWFVLASDNETRCLPVFGNVVAYVSSYFADSACTTRVAGAPVCQVPAYVVEMLTNCPIRWAIYERGPEVTTLYTKSGSSCVAATPGEGRYFAVGPAIAPSSFQVATSAIE